MPAYYNEHDPQKAAWLRELIRQNVIAPGEVDERSITEIRAEELRGFRQCHFFAGIGVWSYALRLAGWPDDRPVWTGSCPCPSFSAAGKGKGFADPRHLWPHWIRLIRECRPATIFGEQVAAAIGHGWLDVVYVDLEAAAYSVGAVVLGACSVGAPHIRQRLYFGAHAESSNGRLSERQRRQANPEPAMHGSAPGNGGHAAQPDEFEFSADSRSNESRAQRKDAGNHGEAKAGAMRPNEHATLFGGNGETGFGVQSERPRLERHFGDVRDWRGPGWLDPLTARSVAAAGATRGFWGDCDWWHARDGKYRPIECGLFPLATGIANRVLKLRGYGDAIVPQVAAEFIKASCEGS